MFSLLDTIAQSGLRQTEPIYLHHALHRSAIKNIM